MTSRLLPKDEWHRLVGTQLETVVPVLPEGAKVIVVERQEEIVACVALYPLTHLEGIWIAPDHQIAARALRQAIGDHTVALSGVVCWAQNPVIGEWLESLGAEWMPGKHYAWKP